jgi:hypothetical protein
MLKPEAAGLEHVGFNFRITRSLDVAKAYLRERYADDREARFGLLASSKDKHLTRFGVMNDFQSTKRVRVGPWYGDAEDAYASRSCRLMEECVTEFAAQGLELDATCACTTACGPMRSRPGISVARWSRTPCSFV